MCRTELSLASVVIAAVVCSACVLGLVWTIPSDLAPLLLWKLLFDQVGSIVHHFFVKCIALRDALRLHLLFLHGTVSFMAAFNRSVFFDDEAAFGVAALEFQRRLQHHFVTIAFRLVMRQTSWLELDVTIGIDAVAVEVVDIIVDMVCVLQLAALVNLDLLALERK